MNPVPRPEGPCTAPGASRQRRVFPTAQAFVLATALLPSTAVHTEPLLVRNQHPLAAPFGLPSPLPSRLPSPGSGAIAATFNWTSFEATDATADRDHTLDGETQEWRVQAVRALGTRLAVHGAVAWRRLEAGSLDGFIDDWHEALGLPEGSRDKLPEDELLLVYRRAGVAALRIDSPRSGFADVPLALGYQVLDAGTRALAAWLTVKLPAGEADDLSGSGATDVALSLSGEWRPRDRWLLFGQLNAAWLGTGDLLPRLQQDAAWSALGGASWQAWRCLELTAQVEANSALFDTGLDDLDGDALVVAVGGTCRTRGGWHIGAGIVEDLEPDASPDVTFTFALQRAF